MTLGQSGWAGMTLALGGWCANNRLPQLLALDGSGNLWLYPNRGKATWYPDADGLGRLSHPAGHGGLRRRRFPGSAGAADGRQRPPLPRLRRTGTCAEARSVVASGWTDVTAIRPLQDVTGLNSTGLALRRAGDVVQYWDLSTGALSSPSSIPGAWAGQRLAQ